MGTLEGLFLAWAGFPLLGLKGLLALVLATLAGIAASGSAEKSLGKKDDPRIVIDEILGALWSLVLIPVASYPDVKKWTVLFSALVLFRIFDIYKLPSRLVQNLKGGFGVVLDDVLSGIAVNLILQVALRILP